MGYGYNFNLDREWFTDIIEAIYKDDRASLDSLDFPCCVEIDEPMLILFEDGDILGIDYSEGSSIRMEMNTLPWDIRHGTNNFHTDQLFRDILGSRIRDIVIASSITQPTFTGSHGLDLAEQPSYLDSISFLCQKNRQVGKAPSPLLGFKFESWFDYGCVSLERKSAPVKLPATGLMDILELCVTGRHETIS